MRAPGRSPNGTGQPGSGTGTGRNRQVDGATQKVRRTPEQEQQDDRVQRIDETLTRLTAAHAGLRLASDVDREENEAVAPPRAPVFTPTRLVCFVLAVIVLGATTFGWATRSWLAKGITQVDALDVDTSSVVDAAAQKGAQNVLIVASATNSTPGAAVTGGSDAGTVAVAHVPAGGGPLTVLSVPNNLEINRPPCDAFDPVGRDYTSQTVPAEARTQLASALAVGGPRCVTRVVQQLTGLSITSYLGIDLDKLGSAVETVGGVQVCVPRPVVDTALGPILSAAGTQQLDGARAGDFLKADAVSGDPASGSARIERQQSVLAAVLGPLLSTTGLLDVGQLAKARPALGAAIVVDGLDVEQVLATATSLHKLDAQGVTFVATPTASAANGRGNVVLRDTDAAALFAAVRTDAALPSDSGSTATTAGPAPGDLTVSIVNASDRSGLAAKVGDTLKQLGFGVGTVGNAPQRTPQTVIRFSPDQESAAELLAASVPSATAVSDPGTTGELQLVLGRSYDDVLRPPATTPATTGDGTGQADQPQVQCP